MNRKRGKGEDYELYKANLKIESAALTKKLNGGVVWNYTTNTPYWESLKTLKGK